MCATFPGDIPENKVVAKVYTRIKFGERTNQVLRRSEMCSLRKLEQSPQVASLDPFVGFQFHTITILYYNIAFNNTLLFKCWTKHTSATIAKILCPSCFTATKSPKPGKITSNPFLRL